MSTNWRQTVLVNWGVEDWDEKSIPALGRSRPRTYLCYCIQRRNILWWGWWDTDRLLRAVDAPLLEVFKGRLVVALSNVIQWKMAGGLTSCSSEAPSNLPHSMIMTRSKSNQWVTECRLCKMVSEILFLVEGDQVFQSLM